MDPRILQNALGKIGQTAQQFFSQPRSYNPINLAVQAAAPTVSHFLSQQYNNPASTFNNVNRGVANAVFSNPVGQSLEARVAQPFLRGFTFGNANQLPAIGQYFRPETQLSQTYNRDPLSVASNLAGSAGSLFSSAVLGGVANQAAGPATVPFVNNLTRINPLLGSVGAGAITSGIDSAVMGALQPRKTLQDTAKNVGAFAATGAALGGAIPLVKAGLQELPQLNQAGFVKIPKGLEDFTPDTRGNFQAQIEDLLNKGDKLGAEKLANKIADPAMKKSMLDVISFNAQNLPYTQAAEGVYKPLVKGTVKALSKQTPDIQNILDAVNNQQGFANFGAEVKNDAAKQVAEKGALEASTQILSPFVEKGASSLLGRAAEIANVLFNRTRNVIAAQGPSGKELAQRLLQSRDIAETSAGKWVSQLPTVAKLSKDEFNNFVDVAEGLAKPTNAAVAKAAQEWSQVRGDIYNTAKNIGLDIGRLENYFPHRYDPSMFQGENLTKAANQLVKAGQAADLPDAISMIRQAQDVIRNRRQGNLEFERLINLPGFERSKDALFGYIESAANRIGQVSTLGQGDNTAMQLIAQIGKEGGNAQTALHAFDVAAGARKYSQTEQSVSGFLRGANAVTKLGLGAISNAGQSVNTATVTGAMRTILSAPKAAFSQEAKDFALRSGVTLDGVISDLREGAGFSGKVLGKITAPGFNTVEKFNRTLAAWAGKDYAVDLARRAASGDSRAQQALLKMGITNFENGVLSAEDQIKAARDIVRRTQFKVDPQDLPGWASSPWGKVVSQFKSFSYNQTAFMKKEVLDPALRGDLGPLSRFIAVGSLVGGAVILTKNSIKGKPTDFNIVNNLQAVGGTGVLGEAANALQYGEKGILQFIAGPTFSTAAQLGNDVGLAFQGKPKQLEKDTTGMIPVVGQTLKNTGFPSTTSRGNKKYVSSADAPHNPFSGLLTYGSSLIQDPKDTIGAVTSGQPIRKVVGGQTIVERQQGLSGLDQGNQATQVDHKIALELGGTNDPSNLQVLSATDNQIKAQVENYLVASMKLGKITPAEAQKRDLNWRNEIQNLPASYQAKVRDIQANPTPQLAPVSTLTPVQVADLKQQVSDIGAQRKQILQSTGLFSMSEQDKNQQLTQLDAREEALKAQLETPKQRLTKIKSQNDAQYSVLADRFKRTEDFPNYVANLQFYIDNLQKYQALQTDKTEQLRLDNVIADKQAELAKLKGYGGFKKPKKGKAPKKLKYVPLKASSTKKVSLKLSLSNKSSAPLRVKSPLQAQLKFSTPKIPSFKAARPLRVSRPRSYK